MPTIDVVRECGGKSLSVRARQVCGMFDCPPEEKQRLHWQAELPIEAKPWNIGLIVGPSGCGKTTVADHLWPEEMAYTPTWDGDTLIDCFEGSIENVTAALGAVGFNTIPAWLRPHHVLSNGEKFRAEIAKRMLEQTGVIVVDEFTSVVDRQVAKVASHAVQKYVRKQDRQLVAVTCHHDVIEWLQPDWVFEPAERNFAWRSLRRRPEISIEVARVAYEAWHLFAPFHYMTHALNKSARCYCLFVDGEPTAFGAVLPRPHPTAKNIWGLSRLVTLPDWQGLGLAPRLSMYLAKAHKALGQHFHTYPAHPALIRTFQQQGDWQLRKRAGTYSPKTGATGTAPMGGRPCAVFRYVGEPMEDKDAARDFLEGRNVRVETT